MSRTRLIVSAIFVVILGVLAAPTAWAGGLKTAPTVATAAAISSNPQGVMLMDVDGDGKQDLVVVEPNSGVACGGNFASRLEVFLGAGNGTFGAGIPVPIVCEPGNLAPAAVAVAHGQLLGGAAHPDDIVVATPGTNHIVVLANTSTAGVVTLNEVNNSPFPLPGTNPNPQGLAVANVDANAGNNNGIIVADPANDSVDVLRGNGGTAATFGLFSFSFSTGVGSHPVSVAVANFGSHAGPPLSTNDIAAALNGTGQAAVLVNTTSVAGTPTFAAAITIAAGTSPIEVAAAPLGSGNIDLVVVNTGSSNITVALNSPAGTFTPTNTSVGASPVGVGIGDLNADTFNDLVVSDGNGAEILFNNGTGGFPGPAVSFAAGTGPTGIALAELDGDTYPDVAVADTGANTVSILQGTPFFAITSTPVSGTEGVKFTGATLMTFQYDGATPTFSATINNWGDAATDTCPTNCSVTGPVAGVYTLKGDHKYAEQGTDNIFVTITDTSVVPNESITTTAASTASSTPAQIVATVADGTLDGTTPATADLPDGAPGSTYTNVVVANFSDQNTGAPSTDFTAQIDWDDCGAGGTPHGGAPGTCAPANLVAGTVSGVAGGPFQVKGTNTFTTGGFFTITTNIVDTEAGASAAQPTGVNVTTHVNITNITVTAAANITPNEGPTGSVPVATFQSATADAIASYSALVDWGDCGVAGTSHTGQPGACNAANQVAGTISGGATCQTPASCTVSSSYIYKYGSAAGTAFQVVAYVTDASDTANDAPPLHTPMTATVKDITITPAASQPTYSITEGTGLAVNPSQAAAFTDTNPSALPGDFTGLSLNWGDSNSTVGAGMTVGGSQPNFTISANPTGTLYKEHGTFTVTFSVTDSGGTFAGTSISNQPGATITVTDAPLTNIALAASTFGTPAAPKVEGVDQFTGTFASFSDGNGSAPATDFDNPNGGGALNLNGSYVDWGDGVQENCSSVAANTPDCFINGVVGGPFTVATIGAGNHIFQKAGTFVPTVHIADYGNNATLGSTLDITTTLTATITSLSTPSAQAVGTQTEGMAFNPTPFVPIMNFTTHRTTPAPVAGDFTASTTAINWGDGNTDTANANLQVVAIGGGVFQLQGKHVYAEETNPPAGTVGLCGNSPCPTTITIHDNVDGSTLGGLVGPTIQVQDAGLTPAPNGANGVPPLGPVAEGAALNNVPVLVFTDANPGATTADFTTGPNGKISVNWGDGNTSPLDGAAVNIADSGCVTTALPTGPGPSFTPPPTAPPCALGSFHLFTVTSSHTYKEGGLLNPPNGCAPGSPNATCQISVTVDDEGGSNITNFNSTSAQIFDAALSNLVVLPVTGATSTGAVSGQNNTLVANVDTWTGTVATFTDANPANNAAQLSDFNVVIAWGDGVTDTCNAPCPDVQPNGVVAGGVSFKIVASHKFVLAGSQITTPVTVTVSDIDSAPGVNQLGPTAGAKAVATSLYQPATVNITPTEGISFSGGVGQFTATVAGHTYAATINWGDGTINAATGFTGGPIWTADGTHTYVEETLHEAACFVAGIPTPCPLTLVVTDNNDGSQVNIPGPNPANGPIPGPTFPAGTATIQEATLTPTGVGSLGSVNETIVTLNPPQINNAPVLTFTDANTAAPAAEFTATIFWGDGTSSLGTVSGAGGNYTVKGSHNYIEGGLDAGAGPDASGAFCTGGSPATCHIYVTVADEGNPNCAGGPPLGCIQNFPSATVNVADAPLNTPVGVALTPASLAVSGNLGTFHDGNPGAPTSDFTASIDWGDGSPATNGTVTGGGGSYTVSGNHLYATTGTLFNVTITVTDVGGALPLIINSSVLTPAIAGTDFLGTASPPSSSVVPGQSVDVLVTLTPQSFGGYNTALQLIGCQIISGPAGPITCTFDPNSVPDVAAVRTAHMTVQTFSQQASLSAPARPGQGNLMRLALLLPGFIGVFGMVLLGGSKRSRRRTILWFLASLLLLTLLIVGCGGGAPVITPGAQATAPGTYTLRILTSDQPPASAVPPPPNPGNGPDIRVTVTVQ